MWPRLFALPFVIGAAILLYFIYMDNRRDITLHLLWFVIPIVTIFIFHKEIQYYMAGKAGRKLDLESQAFLLRQSSWYRSQSPEEREQINPYIQKFLESQEYSYPNGKVIPEDLKILVAVEAARLEIQMPGIHWDLLSMIIFYDRAFISPAFPNTPHHSEFYDEDGALIISGEALFSHARQPGKFVNFGRYELIKYIRLHFPEIYENWTHSKENIQSVFGKEMFQKQIGLDFIDERIIPFA